MKKILDFHPRLCYYLTRRLVMEKPYVIWGISSAGSPVEAVTHPPVPKLNNHSLLSGGIAQLGERLNGIQEVSGSIPLISTITKRVKRKPHFFGNEVFALCSNRDYIHAQAELLQIDIEVDVQFIVPIDLHPFDQAVDDHLLCLKAGGVVHFRP